MEIDFLGLNSNNYTTLHHSSKEYSFPDTWNGGVETSLSLCSSCPFDSQTINEKKKKKKNKKQNWEFPSDRLGHYNQGSSSGQPGLVLASMPAFVSLPPSPTVLYGLNDNPSCSRKNMPELSSDPSGLRMLYPGCRAAADKGTYASSSAVIGTLPDATIGTRGGYTPTVAMARKATLVRFLEKRLHRMNQARATTSHLMGEITGHKQSPSPQQQ